MDRVRRTAAAAVAHEATLAALADLGCDLAQGYYFSRPVDADKLPALVHQFDRAPPPSSTDQRTDSILALPIDRQNLACA